MEELLEIILGVILEAFGELLIELAAAAVADVLSRTFRRSLIGFHRMGPAVSGLIFALLGAGAGLFSLAAFAHPIFGTRGFHGVSLLISPIAAGLGMSLFGSMLQRRGVWRTRIETFRYGFIFALAMAIVRFALVTRS